MQKEILSKYAVNPSNATSQSRIVQKSTYSVQFRAEGDEFHKIDDCGSMGAKINSF